MEAEPAGDVWWKSSHSATGECVEVADGCGLVHVRDSKDKDPDAPILSFSPASWRSFAGCLKRQGG